MCSRRTIMEVPLFHRHGKAVKSPRAKPLKDLVAIVPAAQLLSDHKRQELLQRITENLPLEPARFDGVALSLISNFVSHCQRIPETTTSYYALPGGLIDHALNRTDAALSLFRQFVVQDEGMELSEEQKLWFYALFSAAMLQGIGKLQIDYRVDLFDLNGQLLTHWTPLLESMASVGDYYQFEFLPEGEKELRCRLNLLLARQLMPASGFAWITSDPDVLAVWLALLSEDARSAGTLGAILIRADAIAIQRYFTDVMIPGIGQHAGRGNRIGTFVDTVPESVADKERIVGVEFIKWLTNQLASGKIMLNKVPLLMVPGGLLMLPEAYQWFMRENPEFKNWQAVQHGFLSLGLHSLGIDGSEISRFERADTKEMVSGVVFADYAMVLPEQVQLNNLHTGEVSLISAVELIHAAQFNNNDFQPQGTGLHAHSLSHLSATGDWVAVEGKQSILRSGHKQSG